MTCTAFRPKARGDIGVSNFCKEPCSLEEVNKKPKNVGVANDNSCQRIRGN